MCAGQAAAIKFELHSSNSVSTMACASACKTLFPHGVFFHTEGGGSLFSHEGMRANWIPPPAPAQKASALKKGSPKLPQKPSGVEPDVYPPSWRGFSNVEWHE